MSSLPKDNLSVNPDSKPTSKPSRLTAYSMDHPDSFIDPDAYSLLDYIEHLKSEPAKDAESIPEGKERHITIYHFLGYLRQAFDTLRQHATGSSIPSRNLVINAAIRHEIDRLYSGMFEILSRCRAEFKKDGSTATDIDSHSFVDQFLSGFPLEIPNPTMDKPSKVTVTLSAEIDSRVSTASEQLSITKENIVLICCILALSLQTRDCHVKHIERAKDTMKMLVSRVEMAAKIAEICVEGLKRGAF